MTSREEVRVSPRHAALIGGVAYLVIFVLAIFANFLAIEGLVEPGDAAATASNIMDSPNLLRGALASFIIVFVLDVIIAWALYIVFRGVNADVALLSGWMRMVGAGLLGASLIFLFLVLGMVGDATYQGAFDQAQVDAQTMLFLDGFDFLWLTGLVCFGVHLIAVGYLVVRSAYVNRVLGYLLYLAGAAYILDTLANALLANYDDYETLFLIVVAVSSIVAELWLALWLVFRGGKSEAV